MSAMTADTLLEVEDLRAGYGSLQVLFDVDLDVRAGRDRRADGIERRGQDHDAARDHRSARATSGRVRFDGEDVTNGSRPRSLVDAGMALVPEGRGMLRDLTVAREPRDRCVLVRDRRAVPQATERAYTTFPILGRAAGAEGGPALGRPAADARHRRAR